MSRARGGMEVLFWDFSLALYRRPGVQKACLDLQDGAGLDVNLLLYCCWAGQGGHVFTNKELRLLQTVSLTWQGGILRPMRQLRERIKKETGAEGCYAAAKSLELQLEHLEQSRLLGEVPVRWGKGGREGAAANLRSYLMLAAVVRNQAINRSLETLLSEMEAMGNAR
ncbi:MAG: TIGR02444 family protein [Pseudomonadota bacterium]